MDHEGGILYPLYPSGITTTPNPNPVVDLTLQSTELAIYVTWSAGCTAGAVTIETATTTDYAGTWAVLGTVTLSAASKVDVFHYSGALMAVRCRITTNVTGGTVTVFLYAR